MGSMPPRWLRELLHPFLPLAATELKEAPSTVADVLLPSIGDAPLLSGLSPPSATVALALSLLLAGMYDQTFSSKGCLWTGGAALLSFFAASAWVPAEEEREQLTLPLLGFLGLLALTACTLTNLDQHVIRRGAGFLSAYVCLTLAIDLAPVAAAKLAMLLALLSEWGVAALVCRGVIALLLSRHAIALLLKPPGPTLPPQPAAGAASPDPRSGQDDRSGSPAVRWFKSLRAVRYIQRLSSSTPSFPESPSWGRGLARMATMSRMSTATRRMSTRQRGEASPGHRLSRKEEMSLKALQQFYRPRRLR